LVEGNKALPRLQDLPAWKIWEAMLIVTQVLAQVVTDVCHKGAENEHPKCSSDVITIEACTAKPHTRQTLMLK
jgi:hypothetical protein